MPSIVGCLKQAGFSEEEIKEIAPSLKAHVKEGKPVDTFFNDQLKQLKREVGAVKGVITRHMKKYGVGVQEPPKTTAENAPESISEGVQGEKPSETVKIENRGIVGRERGKGGSPDLNIVGEYIDEGLGPKAAYEKYKKEGGDLSEEEFNAAYETVAVPGASPEIGDLKRTYAKLKEIGAPEAQLKAIEEKIKGLESRPPREEGVFGGVSKEASPGKEKEPWEMTLKEYKKRYFAPNTEYNDTVQDVWRELQKQKLLGIRKELPYGIKTFKQLLDKTAKDYYKDDVQNAVRDGKPVPHHVLEEYRGEPWADEALKKIEKKEITLASGLGALDKEKIKSAREGISFLSKAVKSVLSPTTAGELAEKASTKMIGEKSKWVMFRNQVTEAFKKIQDSLDWLSDEQNMKIKSLVEEGRLSEEELKKIGIPQRRIPDIMKYYSLRPKVMDTVYEHLKARGLLDAYIDNYVSHIWGNNEKTKMFLGRMFSNNKYFTKQRVFKLYEEGRAAGLKDKHPNIVENDLAYVFTATRTLETWDMLNALKKERLIRFFKGNSRPDQPGWEKLDPIVGEKYFRGKEGTVKAGAYWAPEEVARLVNNVVKPSWLRKGAIRGPIFRTLRASNALMNMANLGLSAYHGTFSYLTYAGHQLGLAQQQFIRGDFGGALKSFAKANPLGLALDLKKGGYYRNLLLHPEKAKTPADRFFIDIAQLAGVDPKVDRAYLTSFSRAAKRAYKQGQYGKALVKSPFALIEQFSKPIMERMVPDIKMAAFADLVKDEIARRPNEDVAKIAKESWDKIEDRFGQITYDNLFWDNTLKDILMLVTRSVGWNYGDIREVAGAAESAAKTVEKVLTGRKITQTDLSNRLFFILGMIEAVGLHGALYMALRGIKPKTLYDYLVWPTGKKNEDGTEARVNIASYIRDWIGFFKEGPWRMAANKASPILHAFLSLVKNRDYWDHEIYDPDENWFGKKGLQAAAFFLEQWLPFSFRNWRSVKERGGDIAEQAGQFFGLTAAPGYATRSEAFNYLFERYRAQKGATLFSAKEKGKWYRELRKAYEKKDMKRFKELRAEGIKKRYILNAKSWRAILRSLRVPYYGVAMQRLPAEEQMKVLEKADKKELFDMLWKYATKRAKILYKEKHRRVPQRPTI